MHLQPQQASTQCAADQLADILTSCSLDNQVCAVQLLLIASLLIFICISKLIYLSGQNA